MSDSKPKVLIAEDDDFLRRMYATGLKKQGFETEAAAGGENALEKMREQNPDVFLLDLVMPETSGFEILSRIQEDEELQKTPVVVLSGLGQKEDVHSALEAGAEDYLIKTEQTVKTVGEKLKGILDEQ